MAKARRPQDGALPSHRQPPVPGESTRSRSVSPTTVETKDMQERNPFRRTQSARPQSTYSDELELLEDLPSFDEKRMSRLSRLSILSTPTALPPIPEGYNEKAIEYREYLKKRGSVVPSLSGTAADATEYPGQKQRLLIVMAILMAAFLTALDRTIIATAIPAITNEFHSLDDIGWYGSAFMLTASCFQLVLGRVYSFYSPKYIFLVCMVIFEIGSAICGAAPNSISFILGRAIAGLGTAGIMSGAIIMMVATIPLEKRPIYQGLFGAVFGASSVAGPLVGGAFTTDISWRWCFYLNLPVGIAAIVVLIIVLPAIEPTEPGLSIREQLGRLDLLGELFLFPCIVCLILALQWGGSTYPYSDWRIILLFVVFGLTFIGFVLVQIFNQKSATIPAAVIKNRSMICATFFTITISGCMILGVYFLPLWFQAIKNTTALQSGIDTIPTVLGSVMGSILAGVMVSKLGYYTPFMILGSAGGAVGLGLISTFEINTGSSKWIGYQVILGFCLGAGMQQGSLVAQNVLKKKDVNMGVSLLFLTQQLGSAIFISVGENVFTSALIKNVKKIVGPGFNPSDITNTGATDIRKSVPPALLNTILNAYNDSLRQVFIAGVILAGISMIGACGIEWKSVKAKDKKSPVRKSTISGPVRGASPELDSKPGPTRKSYLNKALPRPPSVPGSERMSQAPTAVSEHWDLPKVPQVPQIARVRHVSELRRSASIPTERARPVAYL